MTTSICRDSPGPRSHSCSSRPRFPSYCNVLAPHHIPALLYMTPQVPGIHGRALAARPDTETTHALPRTSSHRRPPLQHRLDSARPAPYIQPPKHSQNVRGCVWIFILTDRLARDQIRAHTSIVGIVRIPPPPPSYHHPQLFASPRAFSKRTGDIILRFLAVLYPLRARTCAHTCILRSPLPSS